MLYSISEGDSLYSSALDKLQNEPYLLKRIYRKQRTINIFQYIFFSTNTILLVFVLYYMNDLSLKAKILSNATVIETIKNIEVLIDYVCENIIKGQCIFNRTKIN